VMAALLATGKPLAELADVARREFGRNPTGDFSLTPVLSFIKGDRLRHIVTAGVAQLAGAGAGLEDLWKPCFCVVTNFSQAREEVRRRGALEHVIIASASIPGALPPVLEDGDLLVDGGTFNNFPVDVMRRTRGVGLVIGVDLAVPRGRRVPLEAMPTNLQMFLDRLKPKRMRRYRLPTLATVMMNVNIMYSMSREARSHALVDLLFKPPIARVGMLDWKKFDAVMAQGLEHGREVLARVDMAAWRPAGVRDAPPERSPPPSVTGTGTDTAA
jgi:NTE family protein